MNMNIVGKIVMIMKIMIALTGSPQQLRDMAT